MRLSASSISPSPTAARPRSRRIEVLALVKPKTPRKISSGESQETSIDSSTATSAVPTSAPSITASAGTVATRPRSAKDATMSAVAVLLCNSAVTPSPVPNERSRLLMARPSMRRRSAPKARMTPVRTMRSPHSSRATPPRRLMMTVVANARAILVRRRPGHPSVINR